MKEQSSIRDESYNTFVKIFKEEFIKNVKLYSHTMNKLKNMMESKLKREDTIPNNFDTDRPTEESMLHSIACMREVFGQIYHKTHKYYTPEISDLFNGYEYEIQHYDEESDTYLDQWDKRIYDVRSGLCHDDYHIFNEGMVRTPFLTKEDIEAEGWSIVDKGVFEEASRFLSYTKGNYQITLSKEFNEEVEFEYIGNEKDLPKSNTNKWGRMVFHCPSINELRTISKLLNIK